jgi:hypothetical protein
MWTFLWFISGVWTGVKLAPEATAAQANKKAAQKLFQDAIDLATKQNASNAKGNSNGS